MTFKRTIFLILFLLITVGTVSGLLFLKQKTPSPVVQPGRGIVIFTFADGYKTDFTIAYPLLKAKSWAGLAYINPGTIGTKANKLNLEELKKLDAAGWDISSHGYNHVDATTLNPQELTDHLKKSHDWLVQNGFVKGARHYGPPKGGCNDQIIKEASKYYQTVQDGKNCMVMPPGYVYRVISCGENIPWEKVTSAIDKLDDKQVGFLRFHDFTTEDVDKKGEVSQSRLENLIKYIESKNLQVLTLSDLLDSN